MKTTLATLATLLALVGVATVVGVARQLRVNRRASQTPPNVRNADFGSRR